MSTILQNNQKAWDGVFEHFLEASHLPEWGPFGIGSDLHLIPTIQNKVFLEIACGSGRSINYLIEHGAKKVYGLDISEKQITEAKNYNLASVEKGTVELFHQSMEETLSIEEVDTVISVYGFGWAADPEKALNNIFTYLKPGGTFIWSWDHSFFSDITYKNNEFVVMHSYHDEKIIDLKNWKDKGNDAHLIYRKTSTWFKLIKAAGFEIEAYYEPEPINSNRGFEDITKYYSIQKARLVPSSFIFVCKKTS